MLILDFVNISLPLTDPVLIFSLILFIILFVPMLLHRIKIPDLIGLILAGTLIGPHGLGIMERDSSIELFGTVGLLYIMFMAGLEIDIADFKKNGAKSFTFGLYTFFIPMILGTAAGIYLLDFSYPTSILLASMFASHTLMTYPIVSKYGIVKNRTVNIAIGGTVVTCLLALFVLAIIVGMEEGELNQMFWIKLGFSTLVFAVILLWGFPCLGRWYFKRHDDRIGMYIFVLALVFLGAFLAETAGLEGVIGAFLAGLALNKLIPNTSALMNRIEFVGNALFIPFFLISVGMLVDYKVFLTDVNMIWVAVVMCVVATLAKYLSAWLAQKTFRLTTSERTLLFGLSNAQAAATLAAVLVGYEVIVGMTPDGQPIRLLDDSVLNGTIVMILVTCIIASFATQKGAQEISLAELTDDELVDSDEADDHILIPLSNQENVGELMSLAITIKSKKGKAQMSALSVIPSEVADAATEKRSKILLETATKIAAATDNLLTPLLRYDDDVANGIKHVIKENKITDMVIGLRKERQISESFLGNLTDRILSKCAATAFVYRPVQTLATLRRYVVLIPPHAEVEIGFPYWLVRMWNIGRNSGCKMVFYGNPAVLKLLQEVQRQHSIDAEFKEFTSWDDMPAVVSSVKANDALVFIMSRKNGYSYSRNMAKVPSYINDHFATNNCILVYPVQIGYGDQEFGALKTSPHANSFDGIDELGNILRKLFRKNK